MMSSGGPPASVIPSGSAPELRHQFCERISFSSTDGS